MKYLQSNKESSFHIGAVQQAFDLLEITEAWTKHGATVVLHAVRYGWLV